MRSDHPPHPAGMRFGIVFVSLLFAVVMPVVAQAPILSVPPTFPGTVEADRADPEAYQSAMPSIAIATAFIAEKDERGPDNAHIPRASVAFTSGEEVYFWVSLENVSRDPVTGPDGRFAIALRAQVRDSSGAPLSEWLNVHTYEGTMMMAPDDPEYFQNWITGGLGPEVPPGQYQLALEFTDMLRAEAEAQVPAVVVFDLLYPDQ